MNLARRALSWVALTSSAAAMIATPADARPHHRHYYAGRTYYQPTAYRYCRHSSGEAGLIAGGVGGALLGHSVLGHGLLGTALGAVGGALGGRAVDRTITAPQRCYYR